MCKCNILANKHHNRLLSFKLNFDYNELFTGYNQPQQGDRRIGLILGYWLVVAVDYLSMCNTCDRKWLSLNQLQLQNTTDAHFGRMRTKLTSPKENFIWVFNLGQVKSENFLAMWRERNPTAAATFTVRFSLLSQLSLISFRPGPKHMNAN